MNQNRAQRFPAALLAWLGLILGFSVGLFLDQAANLPFDGNLLPALRACQYCLQAAVPVAAEVVKVNRWTLLGAIVGLLGGLVMASLPRLRAPPPAGPTRRLSTFRQAAELVRFSRALSDSLEVQSILRQLHDEALHVTGALCGSTFLFDPESPEHRVALRVGEGVDLRSLSPMEAAAASAGRGGLVADFEQEGEAPPHVGVRSALLVPITHDEITLGLIHLHSEQPGAFDSELYDFVYVLGAQAAVAIQNARRYAEQSRRSEGLRQRVNQLQQLSQIPNAVRVDRSLTTNLNAIAQTMQETADFSLVLISVFMPAGNQLVHTASAGLSPETIENLQHLPLPWERLQPFLREENRSERVYRVPHTQTADLYQALDLGRPNRASEPSAPGQWHPDDMLLAPLYGSRGEIDGLLSVGLPRAGGTPQSLLLEMLEVFASQAGLAIETAHLVTQAEERVSESQDRSVQLGVLTEAAGVIAAALRVDEVVTLSLDQLRRLIPYDTATFWQRELSDGHWRVLGARSYEDSIERVISRIAGAQATVFSEIVATRSVVFVPDVSRDERFTAKEASSMRSWLGVPVLSKGEVLGVLSLEKGEDNFYGPGQVPLALSYANRVAVALDNARLYEESVQRAQELEKENARRSQDVELRSQRLALLNHLATDLAQARDMASLLQLTLETLAQALRVESASGLIIDGEAARDSAQVLATGRWPAASIDAPAALELASNPLLDRLQDTGAPLIVEAGGSPAEGVARPEHFAWVGHEVSAALFLPLMADGRLLGAIGLGGRKFGVADAELGRAIVQQTVTALQYLQLRDRTQEQAGVQQFTRAISRTADFSQLYQVIRLQLAEVAGIQSLNLALYDPARNRVSFPLVVENGQWVNIADEAGGRMPGGLVGHIVQTRQIVRLSGDVAAQAKGLGLALGLPNQHPARGGPETETAPLGKAYLGVPLILGDKLIGVLVAQDLERPDAFDDRTERMLSAISSQVAQALNNAEQYEASLRQKNKLAEQARYQASLSRATAALSGLLDLGEVMSTVVRLMAEALGVDRAGVIVLDEDTSKPVGAARLPATGEASLAALAANPLIERLRQSPGPVTLDELSAEQPVTPDQTAWVGGGVAAGIFQLLVFKGRIVGLVGAGQTQAGRTYAPAEVSLAQDLCSLAAAAVYEARQYEGAQVQLSEQALVNQISRALTYTLDLSQLLNSLQAQLEAWLGPARLSLALLDEERHEVSFPLAVFGGQMLSLAPRVPAGLLRHLLHSREPLLLPDRESIDQELRDQEQLDDELAGARAFLGVPLVLGDRVLGALTLSDPRRVPTFDRQHERILATIAAQIALVLDHRRLFEQTRQALAGAEERATQFEALAAALSVIASALYSEDVVGVTLEQFERVIPYDRAAFWRREAGASRARELRWRCADSRGYSETAEQMTQRLVADDPQLALFAELATTRRIVMVADTAQDSRWQPNGEHATRSWLGVPLVNKGEVRGLLIAEKVEPNTYRASHAAWAQILAGQITAVLTNTYQYEESVQRVLELDERSRRLAFLNRFAAELGGNLNLSSILQVSLQALAESLGVDQATAAVFDETRTAVLALEHYPEVRGPRQLALPGSSLIERFQEAPAPITIEDLAGPEAPARLRQTDWIGQEVRAAMFLPLMSAGKLIGVIGLGQSVAGRRFTPGETELSMGLANLAAVAAQNARLYDRTQQRLAEQAGINQITRALSKSPEPRALYANLREQMEAWVGADHLYLAAYDESRNEVSFPLAEAGGQGLNLESRAASGLVRRLLQQLEPVRLNGEIAQHLRDLGIDDTGLGAPAGSDGTAAWTSCLGVPLVHDEHVLGALILANPKRAETFDESHERILSAVAAQVAAAMSQARQFEQSRQITLATQTRAAQLSLLSSAASIIATATRSEQVSELALHQLERLIPYDSAALWQREGLDGQWRLASVRSQAGLAGGPLGQVSDLATPGQDPLAEVASTRSSLVIADTGQDARFASRQRRPGSWLGFPLLYQGQPLGLIALESSEPNRYSAAHASLAMAFADQAAVSLANVRQYEDGLRRAFELDQRSALLNRALARLSQAVEPRDVLAAALQTLAEALDTSQGVAALFDEGRDNAHARISARYPAGPADGNSLPVAPNSLFDRLSASRAPVAASDVATDSQVQQEYLAWIGPDIQSALFLPLTVTGKLVGMVGLGYAGQRGPFTAAELELAMTLANQAAIAAHNARLHHQMQRRLTELAAITQASRSVSQTIDLRPVFETVRNQVEFNLHADSFYVALYGPVKNQVTYPVAVERGQSIQISPRAPDGLVAHILETGRSLLLTGDLAGRLAERGLLPAAGSEAEALSVLRAKAYLGVPLVSGSHVMGVLAVMDFQHAFAFTDKHERGAAIIAAPLAAAVESARLYEESAQRALALDARAALMARVSAELGEATNLNAMLQSIAQLIAATLVADVGAALVLDEATDARLPAASARFPIDATGELPVFVAVGSPLLKQLQTALAPVTLDELSSEPQVRAELTAWLGENVGAALFLPLIAANMLIGLLAVAQLGGPRDFASAEVDLAMALADRAALAAAHARLQETMQPRLRELTVITRLCQAITRANSLPQLCDVLAAEIGGALEADTVVLALYDAASEALSFPLLCVGGQKLTAGSRAPAGPLAYVLHKRASLLLNGHVEAQLEQLGLTYESLHASGSVPRSYLAVPIILGDQAIGVLAVEDPRQARGFNPSHEFILNTVAGPIALAVTHLRQQAEREAHWPLPDQGHTAAVPVATSLETENAGRWPAGATSVWEGQAKMRPPVRLDAVLGQQLLVACRAVGAEAGAIYLCQAGTGRPASCSDYGLVERLPAGIALETGLVGAAAAAREAIVVDDLTTDPRWGAGPVTQAGTEEDGASGNGANGTVSVGSNGHALGDDTPAGGATTEKSWPESSAPASNGHYRSALAVPLVSAEQVLGVVLFISGRPAAFTADSLPVAQTAANQVALAIQAAGQDHELRHQVEARRQRIAEGVPQPVVEPATSRGAEGAFPVPPAAWRRLALPAGALLLVLCVAGAAINGGALKQATAGLLGGAVPTATPAATSSATVQPSVTVPTTAPATTTAVPVTVPPATLPPASATPTPQATSTRPPTATQPPSASPTPPLPPDVIRLATVVLPHGIVGRLRDAANGNVIGGVAGNTQVQVLAGRQTTADNIVWVHIRLTNTGQTGWISEGLLKYTATPVP